MKEEFTCSAARYSLKMLSVTDLVKLCTRVVMLSALMSLLLATTNMGLPLDSATGSNDVMLVEEGVWSEWREWIPCTRSCGAGVTLQNRTCLRGNCVGPSIQYMSCCVQVCPENHLDFRAQQCQEHNQGGSVDYVPTEEGNEGCTLSCVNPQVTTMSLFTFVRHGTSCKTVEGYNGTCLGQMCARVGCDGVLGSDKIEDKCLRCYSPNEEPQVKCQRFAATSTPNQAAMQGSLPVVIIPGGATTITISHLLLPNEGTLALKSSLGTYYTHGTTEPLQNVAGALFRRTVNESGPHSLEMLTSKGPLSERITVELHGVHQSAPMVDYEYYLLETPDINTGMHGNHTIDIDVSPTDPGSEYAWKYTAYSECSVSCGTGVSIATAVCEDLRHPGRNLPDNICRQNLDTTKPLPIVQKCNLSDCQPIWSVGEWSQCSRNCGNGTQTRQVECLKFIEEGKAADRASGKCNVSTKPEVERVCNIEQCYAEWSTGPWSECPIQCGTWDQQRSVVCRETATGREVDSTHCNSAHKPATTQQCIRQCSECYWSKSKFGKCNNPCGYGTQTRRIRCRYSDNNHRANESCCEGLEVPERTQSCYDTRGSRCKPDWVTHPYGQCQGDCCGEMKRERMVKCTEVTSSGDLVVFPDRECNETAKPVTSELCERTDCPKWNTTEWGECDATCGDGNRYRDVRCVQGDNVQQTLPDESCQCIFPPKPSRVQSCPDLPTCPPPPPCPTDTSDHCETAVESQCTGDPHCCDTDTFLMQVCAESCRRWSQLHCQ